ncbi:BSD-domain-containing protein, partial [Violaceomyces palustris]
MTTSLRAAVAFQKVAGTLTLDRDSNLLQWYPSSSTSNVQPFNLRLNDVSGLSMSKPGSAQVALMLVLSEGHQVAGKPKLLLTFNSDQGTSIQDRETFKVEIASVIASNRQSSRTVTSSNPSAAVAPSSSPSNSKTTTTTMTIDRSKTSTPTPPSNSVSKRQGEKDSNGNSRSNSTRPSPTPRATVPPAKSEIELRVMVLKSNPSLLSLHKDVVGGGSMPDSEFWSHPQRKAMIRAERARQDQRKGRNAMLADPKPTPNEAGEMKLSITPQLIRDMFEQYPVVARAYEENVPEKLDEASFWTRYFQSKLYHRLRTSARSTASQHTMQDDPILDAYLEEEDDGLESRQHHVARNRLLDLGATEEDHQETGNEKDWTMRAGAERRTLPLMRRFNVHSQSLLDSALGQQGEEEEEEEGGTGSNSRKKRRTNGKARGGGFEEEPSPTSQSNVKDHQEAMNNNPYYPEIVIQDLEERRETEKVRLEIGQLESFFKTSTSNTTET